MESILREEVREQVASIGEIDLLVGIPSYNNARTIARVVQAAIAGLAKYFPDRPAVLINSDGGSTDGTPDVVVGADAGPTRAILVTRETRRVHRVVTAYQGMPGKGSAFRTIFEVASRLNAKACAVVDSDLRSITPEWIELLLAPPLQEGYDFVSPLYARHKYDGTITNSIVYPLVRSIYGRRIRQPIGGDFGFSGRLASHYLEHDVWQTDVARFGIDIWMTTTALRGPFKVCQSYLGAKIHDAKDPGSDLSAMLVQVTGSLFGQIEAHAPSWFETTGSEPVPEFGFRYEVGLEPIPVKVARMVHTFESGVKEFRPIYASFLSETTREQLDALLGQAPEAFAMPAETWARTVLEFAAAYHRRSLNTDHLLRSLTPLYLGRTASWVNEAASYGVAEVESTLDGLCVEFERQKPYLIELWQRGGVTS